MKYCHQCGKMLEDHVKFCTACGVPQAAEEVQSAEQPASSKKATPKGRKIFIGCLIAVVVCLVAAVVLLAVQQTGLLEKADIVSEYEKIAEEVLPEGPGEVEVVWRFDPENGELRFAGEGTIADYDCDTNPAPWMMFSGAVRTVVIEEGITAIGDQAFAKMAALTDVRMPESLERIGKKSFYYCTGLSSVQIPMGVRQIGEGAFRGCYGMTSFGVDGRNGSYYSYNGALMSADRKTFIQLPAAVTYAEYAIPETVTQIEAGAFYDCRNLTKITVPSGVSELKELTFCGCVSLKQIVLPMSVRSIAYSAFTEKVYAPDGTYYLGSTAMKKILYDGLDEWFYSMAIGADNDNLYNAALHFVDPWDMPESTVAYFETYLR